jgi:quinol monooxygenase YgiN
MSFGVVATYIVEPGREADVERHLSAMLAPTRAEPGCEEYRVFRSQDDPRVYVLVERYRTEADFEFHKESSHFAEHVRNGIWECLESRTVVIGEEFQG